MWTKLTLHPDQNGAQQLRNGYGKRLVRVRYRYDEAKKRRWKTVELILAERDWEPPTPRQQAAQIVAIQGAAQEREVRQHVKAAGGKWNPRAVVWELPSRQVVLLGLANRIIAKVDRKEEGGHLHIDGPGGEELSIDR